MDVLFCNFYSNSNQHRSWYRCDFACRGMPSGTFSYIGLKDKILTCAVIASQTLMLLNEICLQCEQVILFLNLVIQWDGGCVLGPMQSYFSRIIIEYHYSFMIYFQYSQLHYRKIRVPIRSVLSLFDVVPLTYGTVLDRICQNLLTKSSSLQ